MNKRIFTAISMVALCSVSEAQQHDPFADKRNVWNQRLENASSWLLREGLRFFSEHGSKGLTSHLHEEFLVGPYIPFYAEEKDDITLFGIT